MPQIDDADKLNDLSHRIIGAAIEVHRELGPGMLENVYRICLIRELERANLRVMSERRLPIYFKGERLPCYYRIDLIVNDSVLVELKAVEQLLAVHHAQVLSYLRLTGKPLGLLMNFNVPVLPQGIRRIVNGPVFANSAKSRAEGS